jgi:hypothetical protein
LLGSHFLSDSLLLAALDQKDNEHGEIIDLRVYEFEIYSYGIDVQVCRFVYFCCTYLQVLFEIQNAYFEFFQGKDMQQQQGKNKELGFKQLITDAGCSQKAAEELWKWYDPSKNKGVASF